MRGSNPTNKLSRRVLGGATAALLMGGMSFTASSALAQGLELEEIIVTATRRAETDLQTTPVAVSAISDDEFSKLFAQDIGEIAMFVPNAAAVSPSRFGSAAIAD